MSDSEFGEAYERLLGALGAAVALLRRWDVTSWADWLERDRDRIVAGDAAGIDHLLSAFGGMGSLDDLMIHRRNGHDIDDDEALIVGRQLSDLRSAIRSNALLIKRSLDRR